MPSLTVLVSSVTVAVSEERRFSGDEDKPGIKLWRGGRGTCERVMLEGPSGGGGGGEFRSTRMLSLRRLELVGSAVSHP
jgi:hypothetical protein